MRKGRGRGKGEGVGDEGRLRCHGRGAAVPDSRRRESLTGRWSPVREWCFLFFCPRVLALGGFAGVTAVSVGGGGRGAMVASCVAVSFFCVCAGTWQDIQARTSGRHTIKKQGPGIQVR